MILSLNRLTHRHLIVLGAGFLLFLTIHYFQRRVDDQPWHAGWQHGGNDLPLEVLDDITLPPKGPKPPFIVDPSKLQGSVLNSCLIVPLGKHVQYSKIRFPSSTTTQPIYPKHKQVALLKKNLRLSS